MDQITIVSADGQNKAAIIPERGGMMSSLLLNGSERLFLEAAFENDVNALPGGWPFCFPIVGRLSRNETPGVYLYQGQRYHMDIHGFAWQKPWQVVEHGADMITIELESDEQTRVQYPFDFSLQLHYHIHANGLSCEMSVHNNGDNVMPYSAGFHPYFLVALNEKAQTQLTMQSDYRLAYNDSLTDVAGKIAALDFPKAVSDAKINEQLNHVEGANEFSLTYAGGEKLTMSVKGKGECTFPFIQLYTRENAPFICIEQWMGHPNAFNSAGAMRMLPKGETDCALMNLTIT